MLKPVSPDTGLLSSILSTIILYACVMQRSLAGILYHTRLTTMQLPSPNSASIPRR